MLLLDETPRHLVGVNHKPVGMSLEHPAHRRVVVTGAGIVSAIGRGVEAFWAAIRDGRSGISRLTREDFVNGGPELTGLQVYLAARIRDFDQRALLKHWRRDQTIVHSDRYSWLAAVAADEAVAMSGLERPMADGTRTACIIASAFGGQTTSELGALHRWVFARHAVHPMTLVRIVGSSAAAHISIELGLKGPTLSVNSAGASAANAIALGRDQIRSGLADVALVGGADSTITSSALLAAQKLRLVSRDGCRPFSADRNGTVIGEGAACLVLEEEGHARARGARILAELTGIGVVADGRDILGPGVETVEAAMRQALAEAQLSGGDLGYISACGSGTRKGDTTEAEAIRRALGAAAGDVPVSSTKPNHGHTLGAAGAMQAIVGLKAMETGWLPPTPGLGRAADDCPLAHVPAGGTTRPVRHALVNMTALGGAAASLVLSRV